MKKTLFVIAVLALVFPFAVNAAWWNPLSWSWSATSSPQSIEQDTVGADLPTIAATSSEVVFTDPNASTTAELTAEIAALTSENNSLTQQLSDAQADSQASIDDLTAQVNQCKNTAQTTSVPQTSNVSVSSSPISNNGKIDKPATDMDTNPTFPINITRYDPEMNINANVTDGDVYVGANVTMLVGEMPTGYVCSEVKYTTDSPDPMTQVGARLLRGLSFTPETPGLYRFTFTATCSKTDPATGYMGDVLGRNPATLIKALDLNVR